MFETLEVYVSNIRPLGLKHALQVGDVRNLKESFFCKNYSLRLVLGSGTLSVLPFFFE